MTDNERILAEAVTELQHEVQLLTMHLMDMQQKIDNNPIQTAYTHEQSWDSNMWTVYHSFYGQVGVQVYVEDGNGRFRSAQPSIESFGSQLNIHFDSPQRGYVVVTNASDTHFSHGFNSICSPCFVPPQLVEEIIEEPKTASIDLTSISLVEDPVDENTRIQDNPYSAYDKAMRILD